QGCQCFLQAEGYIRQQPSPLAIFPLRSALGGFVHFAAALVVVLVVAGVTNGLPSLGAVVCLAPGLLLIFAFAWSVALLAGIANVLFRDTEHLLQVAFQVLFYATPIIYPAETLDGSQLSAWPRYNPLAALVSMLREPLYRGGAPDLATSVTAT